MALEDMIGKCIDEGVTHFELHDCFDGCGGGRASFHWDLYRGDPVKWVDVVFPWNVSFEWCGFGPHPGKLWGVMPFGISTWPSLRIGILTGGERHGWQMTECPSFEDGLRSALGTFLCDSEGAECRHEICDFHGTEYCD